MSNDIELLTAAEVAEMLRMPTDSFRYRVYTGDAPVSIKLGKRRLWRREDVSAYIESKYAEQDS